MNNRRPYTAVVPVDAHLSVPDTGDSLKAHAVPRVSYADFLRPEYGRIASNAVCRTSLGVSGSRKAPDGHVPLRAPPPAFARGYKFLKTHGGMTMLRNTIIRALAHFSPNSRRDAISASTLVCLIGGAA